MSKTVGASLAAHLDGVALTIATCWKVTRADATVLAFTDHDRDIVFDGVTYDAQTGYNRSAISQDASLNVGNLELDGMLDSTKITSADLRAGLYDFASIEIFLVNWDDLTMGRVILRAGTLGEVKIQGQRFVAELRGKSQALTNMIIGHYLPDCMVDLGSTECGVNLGSFTESGTVASIVTARRVFTATISGSRPAGFFNGGLVNFATGDNAPLPSMEVKSEVSGTVTLFLPAPLDIDVSDTFSIIAGCDKTAATCKAKFANLVNFRGHGLFVPGLDAALETPDA